MKARVHIRPKTGVLDPQGRAIAQALKSLGFDAIGDVRQGKLIEIELAGDAPADAEAAQSYVRAMCEKLLANTVIESYSIEIGE